MHIVDLSLPIKPHFRWPTEVYQIEQYEHGFRTTGATIRAHSFTHVDSPLHLVPGTATINEVPLEQLVGPASVVDLTFKRDNEAITPDDLERAGGHVEPGDIVFLRTDLGCRCSWETADFWERSPYLTREAAEWFLPRRPKAVGYDFPQDYVIREHFRGSEPDPATFVVHQTFLRNNILNIEYLTNLHKIHRKRFMAVVLPLKLETAEGAPARVVALEFE
jgi:kynurenine formamidase